MIRALLIVLALVSPGAAALRGGPLTLGLTQCGGPATPHPGPASIGGCGTSTTTAAPSWVSATLGAWMLDEASGTRVNAQGTTNLDFVPTGTVTNDTVNKMEGTAAANFAGGRFDSVALLTLPSTDFTYGCWLRTVDSVGPTGRGIVQLYHSGTASGFYGNLVNGVSEFDPIPTTGKISAPTTTGVYMHWVGTNTATTKVLYKDGVQVATAAGVNLSSQARTWQLVQSSNWNGQMDECFLVASALTAPAVCRICSCGLRGEQCTCNGAAFVSTGRNATSCGSCTLPANCAAAVPSLLVATKTKPRK